jgi:hypothetical protein
MSTFSHCQQCGRKLRDVIFCPWCEQCLCSCLCLEEHKAHHVAPTARQVGAVKPAVLNVSKVEKGRNGVERRSER